jgi:hypothetical protein
MKVTIEEIKGEQYTVVWLMDILGNLHDYKKLDNYIGYNFYTAGDELIATALPALPQYLHEENAYIFDMYRGHQLYAMCGNNGYIPFARTKQGERIEVAICEKS